MLQVNVDVINISSDEIDANEAEAGENIKVKLKGVEEEVCFFSKFISAFTSFNFVK